MNSSVFQSLIVIFCLQSTVSLLFEIRISEKPEYVSTASLDSFSFDIITNDDF